MWISIASVTLAVAVGFCVVAIMMRPKPVRGTSQSPPAPALQAPPLSAQEYAEGANVPRPVSPSLPEHLRQHYGHILNEPIPAHLTALVRRLENLTISVRGT